MSYSFEDSSHVFYFNIEFILIIREKPFAKFVQLLRHEGSQFFSRDIFFFFFFFFYIYF